MEQVHFESLETVGALVPAEAYLYFPKKEDQRVYISGKLVRYIFFGNTVMEKEEEDRLKQFKAWLTKKNLHLPNPRYYQDQRILLFLAGNNYKPEQTYKAIVGNREWRLENFPAVLTPKRRSILQNGYIYVCGRDHKFRPIIVLKQHNLETDLLDEYIMASIYGFQFIINNMFLPGQVQNWIFIHDLDGMGVFDIPIDSIKKVNAIMSSGYGGKLFRLFLVNAPSLIAMIWTPAKYFIDPVTVEKISLDGGIKNTSKLFEFCDKSQVQVKYGGTRPNMTQYWPPQLPQPVFRKQDLVSEKQYRKMYLQGKLKSNFISPNIDDMP